MVTIKTSFFPEARGARGEGGVEKVKSDEGKKKVKSLQYRLEPLGVPLYHFSFCTDLE